jgi:hypothetical protein
MGSSRPRQALVPKVRHLGCLIGLLGTVSGCHRDRARESFTVASVQLSCWPIARGVQCHLLALSRDAGQSPRDVTANTAWRLSGPLGVQVSAPGLIQSTADGDVDIEAEYQSRRAHQMVRLARGGSGQLLIIVRGTAFATNEGRISPLAGVRIEVVRGADSGRSVTTGADGAYDLAGIVPGTLAILATRAGFAPTELSVQVGPGDGHVNVVMRVRPATDRESAEVAKDGKYATFRIPDVSLFDSESLGITRPDRAWCSASG